ncbi:uncharacterized protein CC84DRAFT_1228730 [Paraphaeosphaeria sporulosa]|uniref:Heterokaryon incompatibility domain-containing protein n=1 Tax=Paraphaeosphaeria sporulosa TaxID=1460663 RepID=A0A177C3X1_9PLEO|nr:uncharacterized protein CC84DRAFT_1228730 [Paraphaeosphaeria sporulosa]OAG01582.1 hypothetical protein CC84DRAFT_1228730 [Paraphaeosphaeria sporulosa]
MREQRLRLVFGAEILDLSECDGQWGMTGLPSLKSSNLEEGFKKVIHWGNISSTPLPALCVENWLGVKWLWIDSLCIIEGDDSDGRHGTCNVANIYKHATLRVAADAAKDARGGLFQFRRDFELTPLKNTFQVYRKRTWPSAMDGTVLPRYEKDTWDKACPRRPALHSEQALLGMLRQRTRYRRRNSPTNDGIKRDIFSRRASRVAAIYQTRGIPATGSTIMICSPG